MKYNDLLRKLESKEDIGEELIDLSNQYLIDDQIITLVERLSENKKTIKSIDFSHNLIGNKGAIALSTLNGLNYINLSHNNIESEGAMALFKSNFERLNLSSNFLDDKSLSILIDNTTLTDLDLSENTNISEEGYRYLSKTKLKKLSINNTYRDGDSIAKSISNPDTTFTELNLVQNGITDEGAKALVANKKLRKLNLFLNSIECKGAEALSTHSSLTELDISDNNLDDNAAKELINTEKLKKLYLSGNDRISDICGVMFFFKNTKPSLKVIDRENGYGEAIDEEIINNDSRGSSFSS